MTNYATEEAAYKLVLADTATRCANVLDLYFHFRNWGDATRIKPWLILATVGLLDSMERCWEVLRQPLCKFLDQESEHMMGVLKRLLKHVANFNMNKFEQVMHYQEVQRVLHNELAPFVTVTHRSKRLIDQRLFDSALPHLCVMCEEENTNTPSACAACAACANAEQLLQPLLLRGVQCQALVDARAHDGK